MVIDFVIKLQDISRKECVQNLEEYSIDRHAVENYKDVLLKRQYKIQTCYIAEKERDEYDRRFHEIQI